MPGVTGRYRSHKVSVACHLRLQAWQADSPAPRTIPTRPVDFAACIHVRVDPSERFRVACIIVQSSFDDKLRSLVHLQTQMPRLHDEALVVDHCEALSFVPDSVQHVEVHLARCGNRRFQSERAVGLNGRFSHDIERRFQRDVASPADIAGAMVVLVLLLDERGFQTHAERHEDFAL